MRRAVCGVLAISMLLPSYAAGSIVPSRDNAQDMVAEHAEHTTHGIKKRKYLLQRDKNKKIRHIKRRPSRYPKGTTPAAQKVGGVLKDAFILNVNLVSWDSFKIIGSIFPFFISARMLDETLQMRFYDPVYHKNIHQMPGWCHDVAQKSIAAPIVLLGLQGFFAQDEEIQQTGRMLLIGLPFVIWGKELIKKARFDSCLRPWNEKFSCKKRSYGGFPSGHTAEAVYTAVLYGMRFGPKYAIPLGILASIIGLTFVACNRHYVSQIVAGAGLGAMYGVAANRLIDQKLGKNLTIGMAMDQRGAPSVKLSYRF